MSSGDHPALCGCEECIAGRAPDWPSRADDLHELIKRLAREADISVQSKEFNVAQLLCVAAEAVTEALSMIQEWGTDGDTLAPAKPEDEAGA